MQRKLTLIFVIFLVVTSSYSQEVTVRATTNKKEVARILREGREKSRINQAFFVEHDRCREFLRAREWAKAESSCRLAVLRVEKLPKEHVLERSSARASLAIALLWQRRSEEAIVFLNKSLAIRKTVSSDSDAEIGDLYFLLGQAHNVLNDIPNARAYYEKAESSYRAAFIEIGDDYFRSSYVRRLRDAVEAHYNMAKSAGLAGDAEKLQSRMAKVEKDFAKYLNN